MVETSANRLLGSTYRAKRPPTKETYMEDSIRQCLSPVPCSRSPSTLKWPVRDHSIHCLTPRHLHLRGRFGTTRRYFLQMTAVIEGFQT